MLLLFPFSWGVDYLLCFAYVQNDLNDPFQYAFWRSNLRVLQKNCTLNISIYTLSDLGDLSNLIGSLSRTIQQYSPPSEWIMCELGVFPIFLENDLLKVDKILGLTFFKASETWKDSIRRFSIYCSWVLCSMDCLQLPCIRVEEAVSWTQRFLTRKFRAQKS